MLETVDIEGVEIFAVGTWNGDTYKAADLDAMVEAYEKTRGHFDPFLKISHDDSQKLAAKSGLSVAELPAIGIVANLRRVGDKLVADFLKVPKKVAELMNVGAYRARSAEIWEGMKMAGEQFKFMLKAVGLLGAEAPGVDALNTLDDIIALYGKAAKSAKAYDNLAAAKVYSLDLPATDAKEVTMTEAEKQALAAAESRAAKAEAELKAFKDSQSAEGVEKLRKDYTVMAEKVKTIEADSAADKTKHANEVGELQKRLSGLTEERDHARAELETVSREKQAADDISTVEKLISDKKINPAQKDFALEMLKTVERTGEKKFKVAETEYSSPRELLIALFKAGSGVGLPTESVTETGKKPAKQVEGVMGVEDDEKAKAYLKKHELPFKDYKKALAAVRRGEV